MRVIWMVHQTREGGRRGGREGRACRHLRLVGLARLGEPRYIDRRRRKASVECVPKPWVSGGGADLMSPKVIWKVACTRVQDAGSRHPSKRFLET